MKTTTKIITLILTVLLLTTVFSGCGSDGKNNEKASIALVIGAHKYNPRFTVSTQLNEAIYNVARSYGEVSVTVSSGNPETVANWSLDVEKKDVGEAKLKQIAQANTKVIVSEIANISANNPEVDTLAAIIQAVNNLSESKSPVKNLIIYDSGLSTTGYLDFTKPNLILSDKKCVVNQLQELHSIPKLKGINVTWYGVGQVRGEQTVLDSDNKYKLKSIWESILKAGNPESLSFVDAELTSEYEDSNFPDVSIVDLPTNNIEVTTEEPKQDTKIFIQLTDEKLSFKPDIADFVNEAKASSALDKVAENLKNCKDSIYIIGSCATYGPQSSTMTLSKKRANKVKTELIKRGVNNSITSVGIGSTECVLRTNDVDSSGNLIESQAKQNRAVFIISENSNTISKLKQEGVL